MNVNLDFSFIDDRGSIILTGWDTQSEILLQIQIGELSITPSTVTRHRRRDLRSHEPLGFVAVFPGEINWGDSPSNKDDPDNGTVIFVTDSNDERIEISGEHLRGDAARLIDVGVNEVFYAILKLIARGTLALGNNKNINSLSSRLSQMELEPAESAEQIVAVDSCQITVGGQGVIHGWALNAKRKCDELSALSLCSSSMTAVEFLPGSLARADLSGFGDRYFYTGVDGFCGGWHFESPPTGPTKVVIFLSNDDDTKCVIFQATPATPTQLAMKMTDVEVLLADPIAADQVRRSILPKETPALSNTGLIEPNQNLVVCQELIIVLDHDLPDSNLRDVLLQIKSVLPARVRLVLLRPKITSALSGAFEGAQREIVAEMTMERLYPSLNSENDGSTYVIYARSSTLVNFFMLDIPLMSEGIHLLYSDPIASVSTNPYEKSDRFLRDRLPFLLYMPVVPFVKYMHSSPGYFLTEEVKLRLLADHLASDSSCNIHNVAFSNYYEGNSGPNTERFNDGSDPHDYDARSRKLLSGVSI